MFIFPTFKFVGYQLPIAEQHYNTDNLGIKNNNRDRAGELYYHIVVVVLFA